MFGRIAGVYDFLNHFFSLGIDFYWRRQLAALAKPGASGLVADLAAGTLDVAIAILKAHPDAIIPAIDFCTPMLARGARKLDTQERKRRILPCAGNALALPLADNQVDAVTMAFGIRNIPDRRAAFAEMLRVLRPGGRACILEFSSGKERIWGGLYNLYLNKIMPALGRAIARDPGAYNYLAATIRSFPAAEELAREMEAAGFRQPRWRRLTSGIVCLHWAVKPD